MILLGHESQADAEASGDLLSQMGWRAIRLLEECVEKQGITRHSQSATLTALEDAGFVYVREEIFFSEMTLHIAPCHKGEEALDVVWSRKGEDSNR